MPERGVVEPSAPIAVDAVNVPAFALTEDYDPFESDLHQHHRHQLLYAVSGTLSLEAEGSVWLLPPQRAAWIGAEVPHRAWARQPVAMRTVFFRPEAFSTAPRARCCVFSVDALAREMIVYAMRWQGELEPSEEVVARPFFEALAALCTQWSAAPAPWRLPAPRSPLVARAMGHVQDHLDGALTLAVVAEKVGASSRTLSRRFSTEAGMSWGQYVRRARIVKAMELLLQPGYSVTEVAFSVGFESPGAFTHAFKALTGQRPRDYRTAPR
ncbi:MAG: helix-turn-helix domain-containing protein [Bradymonadia bacterium]